MRILILIFLLTGCGKGIEDFIKIKGLSRNKAKTDPIFSEFINSFKLQFNVNVKVPIIFKEMDDKHAGVCYKYSDGYKEININKKYWDLFSQEQKEQLIYHELGHCVFNKGHDDTLLSYDRNCPNSIMRSYMFSWYEVNRCYIPEYNHYMENLAK
jgi:hypothetical protein